VEREDRYQAHRTGSAVEVEVEVGEGQEDAAVQDVVVQDVVDVADGRTTMALW
jgi:hypothetical protein